MTFMNSRLQRVLLALFVCVSFSNFGILEFVQGQTTRSPRVANIYDAQREVGEYVDSGRYDRDVAKVVASARAWLDRRVPTARNRPSCSTSMRPRFLNWPQARANGWARITNGPCDLEKVHWRFRAWQAMAEAKAIAPTLALAQHARKLGVAVFFITGRPARLREATERNLRGQGYEWTELRA